MRAILMLGITACCTANAANAPELHRVRGVILDSRQMGAHGLGYGERSLNELSRKLKPADVSSLIVLLDDKDRSAANGAIFGLASQCGAAIEPVYTFAIGAEASFHHFGHARDVLAQIANYARCAAVDHQRAREKSALLESAQHDFANRRAAALKRRDAANTRLEANALKMLDPAQRASVSREDCFAIVERTRAASGVQSGANANIDALYERAKANCLK